MIEWGPLVILAVCCVVGFLAVFLTTFGTFIILCGAVAYAVLTEFQTISWGQMILLATLYLVGEVIESLSMFFGARWMGASKAAGIAAVIGGLLGLLLGAPVLGVGAFLGALFGMFFAAFLAELWLKHDVTQSLKAGAGSVLGRLGSIVVKCGIALGMFLVIWQGVFRS